MSRNTCRIVVFALFLLLAACSSGDTGSESRSPEPSGSAEPQVNQSIVTADQSSTTSTTTTPLEIRDTVTFRAVRVRYFQISDRSFVCGWYNFGPTSFCTEIVEVGQFALGDGPSPWTEVRPGEFNTGLLDISGLLDDNNLLTMQAVEVSSTTEIHS